MTPTGAHVAEPEAGRSGSRPMLPRIADFVALLKPRPMSIVVFTAIAGLIAAPGSLGLWGSLLALTCIALGGGGSAVLNMWFERDIDARMARTASRPIPAGRVTPQEALAFGIALIVGSVAVMALAVNPVAGVMLALTIAFYGVVYTMWLKRLTPLNVVLGGGGASLLTPLTGWAAVTGSIGLEPLLLFAWVIPWTPPHVWSQALVRRADYENAGVPMMPVVAGPARTRQLILVCTALHVPLALAPLALGTVGVLWAATATIAGLLLLRGAYRLSNVTSEEEGGRKAWAFYRHSILYIVVLFSVLAIERGLGIIVPLKSLAGIAG